ncbi:hypothetical protein BH20ACI3_BH20ACI3_32820 [soil metagenome]
MSVRSMTALIAGSVLALFAFTTRSVNAQVTGAPQLAANEVAAINPKKTENGDARLSTAELEVQMKAQQAEILELRTRLNKLEALLETVASNQPARAGDAETAEGSRAPAGTASYSANLVGTPAETAANSTESPQLAAREFKSRRELLPDIGQIGAQVGMLVGFSQNPFKANNGFLGGGFIDLPLKKVKGGKISYEIMASLQRTTTNTKTTSAVNALVNSVLNRELGNPPSVNNLFGPLPLTNDVVERQTVLTVVPFSLKYTVTSLDQYNFRPYVVGGLGTYVTLSTQNTTKFNANQFVGIPAVGNLLNTLLGGPQVAGLVPAAPELRARGQAAGQGDFRFGLNVGGGFEVRLSPRFSFGLDYRFNRIEGINSSFSALAAKPTIHF